MPFCMHVRNTSATVMKQITMSTSVETNKEAVKFMLTFVAATLSDHDGNQFCTKYTCRPCFAKLENGSRHYRSTMFISKLRAAAWATESIKVAVNEPFPSLVDRHLCKGHVESWLTQKCSCHFLNHTISDTWCLIQVIITLIMLWLVISHGRQQHHWVKRDVIL